MELDELKLAWHALDQRLQDQHRLQLRLLRQLDLERVRRPLCGLGWTIAAQFAGGAAMLWLAVPVLAAHAAPPHLLAAALAVLLAGGAVLACAARQLALTLQLDYQGPVVALQRRLATLQRFLVRSGTLVGLPFWVLWVPLAMLLFARGDIDLYAHAPSVVQLWLGAGTLGLVVSWGLLHLARRRGRESWAAQRDRWFAGASLQRAQRALDEIARFERE